MSLKNFIKTSASLVRCRRRQGGRSCTFHVGFPFRNSRRPVESWLFGKMEKSWISTVLAEDIYMMDEYFDVCFFVENTRAWNRMQEMDMVRLTMIFIGMGIRVGSTYIVEIIKLMFKTTAASIWPLSQYGWRTNHPFAIGNLVWTWIL